MKKHCEKFTDYADAIARILELYREHSRRLVAVLVWHRRGYWLFKWHKGKA